MANNYINKNGLIGEEERRAPVRIAPKASAAAPAPAAENASPAAPQTPAASPYSGLSGLSDQTNQMLGEYSQGYKPSESVTAAQQYLQNVINGKPGAWQSPYKNQLESLYNQVMNQQPFTFDLNGNALYDQYRQQYTRQGQQAMMDTMGQAATLTGGYGNSFAQTAGQQAYQDYLAQLNDVVPELYQMALGQHNQQAETLRQNLALTQGLEDSAYGQHRDAMADWNTAYNQANEAYQDQRDQDFANYTNLLNYWNSMAQQENAQYNTDREMAYSQAMTILQNGKMPSDELLAAAGISAEDAKLLKKSSGGGGGSGSRSYGGGSGGSSGGGSSSTSLSKAANNLYTYLSDARTRGMSNTTLLNGVTARVNSGTITPEEGQVIISKLGIG